MSSEQVNESTRGYTHYEEIFRQPDLDIYTQMAYIVLKSTTSETHIPELKNISKLGRMSDKQMIKALQNLVELKILSNKFYRRMVGDFMDDRLSWAAKGLFLFCKDNPNIDLEELLEMACESGEDHQSIRKSLKELSDCGYLEEYPAWKRLAI
ncbi:hypothetical protein [Paenibacillus aestuarii]|uniref:Uncharacterized protein n=1 Tax=Paenibacillus aestuarii TaxID=516965 RepID=A0ABW0KCT5_9BACL|nr:hypothetical protein [Paenibacillus aestuarii]